jgi:hypothetical protein
MLKVMRRARRQVRACGIEGCAAFTTGDKSFCTEHADLMVYAERLKGEIEARTVEIAAVKAAGDDGWQFVAENSRTAVDVLGCVRRGCKSVKAIAADTDLGHKVTTMYLQALVERRLVSSLPGGVYLPVENGAESPGVGDHA